MKSGTPVHYLQLRKTYPRFIYRFCEVKRAGEDLHFSFHFVVPPDIEFHPSVVFRGVPAGTEERVGHGTLNNLAFHLGLAEIPSYWKATCSPEIHMEAAPLNEGQLAWFKDLLVEGMGQYFFENQIDFTAPDFLTLKAGEVPAKPGLANSAKPGLAGRGLADRALVPVGGGKDAVVTLELLKGAGVELRPFLLNPKPEQLRILEVAGLENPISAERTLDPKLLELNRRGYLNGHTPFSATLAFIASAAALLFDYQYIALSNERSSNEGNVEYRGKNINHQYSKSFAFEQKFRDYSKRYLAENLEYFSFLRPLWELQIAKLFSRYPQYLPAFLSCNEAHKTYSGTRKEGLPREAPQGAEWGKWCGACAKCLFVFLALCPFVGEKRTSGIFGRNLLQDKALAPLLAELTGEKAFKPFECVGTAQESRIALALCKGEIQDHPLLHGWNADHALPPRFEKVLGATIDREA